MESPPDKQANEKINVARIWNSRIDPSIKSKKPFKTEAYHWNNLNFRIKEFPMPTFFYKPLAISIVSGLSFPQPLGFDFGDVMCCTSVYIHRSQSVYFIKLLLNSFIKIN